MLPVSDSDGEGLTTFTAGHHHTLKVFEDGVEAFTTAAPILNGVDAHSTESRGLSPYSHSATLHRTGGPSASRGIRAVATAK